MTVLAVTITHTGAVLSQDEAIYEVGPDYRERVRSIRVGSFDESVSSCYAGGGDPKKATVMGSALKIMPQPRFRMAIAGTGSFRFIAGWHFGIIQIASCDIVDLNTKTPEALRKLRNDIQTDDGVVIVHAGYSRLLGRGIGYAYASGADFEPEEIPVGGTLSPSPDPTDPEYAHIHALWTAASQGARVRELHVALMVQQRRSWLAGKMGCGFAMGDAFDHVIVGPDCIMIETAKAPDTDRRSAA